MPAYTFFLSYASKDRDPKNTVRQFYEALSERIYQLGVPRDEVGFLDESDLNLGDPWPDRLADALQNCRSLVCLYSPWYFRSDYAGREVGVFLSRLKMYARDRRLASAPALIFPVLLEELAQPAPAALAHLQYDNNRYPRMYRDLRLRRLLQSRASREYLDQFVDVLARDIFNAVSRDPLPPLPSPPDVDRVESLFGGDSPAALQSARPSPSSGISNLVGPGFVRFFFVAGTRDELGGLRRQVEHYGAVRGLQWKPYSPPVDRYAPVLAQEIATQLNLTSLPEPLNFATAADFAEQLQNAQANGNLVVLLVDTWTLCLDRYLQLMQRYDSVDLWNTAVLVVWNNADSETAAAVSRLQRRLSLAFVAKRNRNDPYAYREITSVNELSASLADVLAKIQLKIIDITDQIARAEGDHFIPRPTISGPAGR